MAAVRVGRSSVQVEVRGEGRRGEPSSPASHPNDAALVAELNARDHDRLVLIRQGCVLTMDPAIPDLLCGDILIQGTRIRAVAPHIDAPSATVIDARGCIVLPGFIDSHRHVWPSAVRRWAANANLVEYRVLTNHLSGIIRPADVYVSELMACASALEGGVTTLLDWCHLPITAEHTDAAIEGLHASGMRTVFGYGPSRANIAGSPFPHDIERLRKTWFASSDQLGGLNLAADPDMYQHWRLARELDVRISAHLAPFNEQAFLEAADAGLVRNDTYFIHCTNLSEKAWQRIEESGCHVSVAPTGPAMLGIAGGIPAIQDALDHNVIPSLSGDTEVSESGDLFTEMRLTLCLQRAVANGRAVDGELDAPPLLSAREVLAMATIEGARTLGLERRTGSITPGKEADIQMIRHDDLASMPLNNAYGTVVLSADRQSVQAVVVAGRIVKWGGKMVDLDVAAMSAAVTASRDWLVQQSGWALDPVDGGFSFAAMGAPDAALLATAPAAGRR